MSVLITVSQILCVTEIAALICRECGYKVKVNLCISVHFTCHILPFKSWAGSISINPSEGVQRSFLSQYSLCGIIDCFPCTYHHTCRLGLGWCRILPGIYLWAHDRSCILNHRQERRYTQLLHHFSVPCSVCPLPGDYWYPVCSSNVQGNTATGEKGKVPWATLCRVVHFAPYVCVH